MKENDMIIRDLFKDLETHESSLSPNQNNLVKSMKKYYARYKKLSERQMQTLLEIRKIPLQKTEKKQEHGKIQTR